MFRNVPQFFFIPSASCLPCPPLTSPARKLYRTMMCRWPYRIAKGEDDVRQDPHGYDFISHEDHQRHLPEDHALITQKVYLDREIKTARVLVQHDLRRGLLWL